MSAVSQIDTTAVQALIDARNEIERWADHAVEFHFATILSPWIRRALVAGGFGQGIPAPTSPHELASAVPYHNGGAPTEVVDSKESDSDDVEASAIPGRKSKSKNPFSSGGSNSSYAESIQGQSSEFARVLPVETPFFHLDLTAAVRSAESGLYRTRTDE